MPSKHVAFGGGRSAFHVQDQGAMVCVNLRRVPDGIWITEFLSPQQARKLARGLYLASREADAYMETLVKPQRKPSPLHPYVRDNQDRCHTCGHREGAKVHAHP